MSRLVVRNATLHDGSGGTPMDGAVLVVEDGRIVFAGPERRIVRVPFGADVLDAEGAHLIPGLIDCHVHLSLSAGADFMAEATCSEEEAVERGISNAAAQVGAGVTTVRDLGAVEGSAFRILSLVAHGDVPGPRIITAGRVLTVRGGHAHMLGIEADTPEELVAAIDLLHKSGAGVVKIVATGGVLTQGVDAQSSRYPEPVMRAAVEAAHVRGLRVAAHAIGAEGIVSALRAGVDSVEHGCFLTEEAVSLFERGSQWLVPTLSAPHNIILQGDKVPDYALAKSVEVGTAHRASMRRAWEAGVAIASGTDAGTPFNVHGGLAGELALYAEEGMPLGRLLAAATSEGARLLGLASAGFLREGFVADCVVLGEDPLQSVSAYRDVRFVVQAGRVVRT